MLLTLVRFVEGERRRAADLLAAAKASAEGEPFSAGGEAPRRPVMKAKTTGRTWAEEPENGQRRASPSRSTGPFGHGRWSKCSTIPASASRSSPSSRTTALSSTSSRPAASRPALAGSPLQDRPVTPARNLTRARRRARGDRRPSTRRRGGQFRSIDLVPRRPGGPLSRGRGLMLCRRTCGPA